MAYFALRLHENPSRDEKSRHLTSLNHFISLAFSENNMAPVQKHFTALVTLFKCLLTMVSVAVSLFRSNSSHYSAAPKVTSANIRVHSREESSDTKIQACTTKILIKEKKT